MYGTFVQSFAQLDTKQIPLASFLASVTAQLPYSFSYADQDIEAIRITPLASIDDIQLVLAHLKRYTNFNYTLLADNTTITIQPQKIDKQLCGRIRNPYAMPIADALITVGSYSTISDQNGIFQLPNTLDPQALITITYLGYEPLEITYNTFIQQSSCTDITLIPKVEELHKIVLTNYLIKGINKQPDGAIRIDYNNFGILPGLIEPDLLQTIQALPGILSVNETVSDINVRGGTNDQNLILWDGIKMYQSSHFFGLISAFNPYLTQDVELYKNGSSSRYGDGVSSVIAMNTSNRITDTLHASIGMNMISVDGFIDTPLGRHSSLQVASRHSINEVLETPTYDQYFDKAFQNSEVSLGTNSDEQFSFYDLSLRWLYQLSPKDLIKVNAITMRNNLVFQENTQIANINTARESSIQQHNIAAGISYRRQWTPRLHSEALFYGTSYELEAINAAIENNQRLLQENTVLENGIKVDTHLQLTPATALHNGYQFNETGIANLQDINNPIFRERIKEVIRTHSIYSEWSYKPTTNSMSIHAGLRANYFEKFNRYTIEPRLSIFKKITDHLTLELLGELKSQTTSQVIDLQNDFLGIENRRWVLATNDAIPILQSQQASVGLSYNHQNWLINTDLYYKEVDGISTRSQGFQNQYEFVNDQGSYTVMGIDFLINKRFKNFNTWLSYSYADNTYTFQNLADRTFLNNIDIKHQVQIALAYNLRNFKFSGGINWHSGKPSTPPNSDTPISNGAINYAPPNSSRIQAYTRVDASATYQFRIARSIRATAGISVWNLLNQQNTFNTFYEATSDTTLQKIDEQGLKFTPNAVFRIHF